ncbi:MAG: glycosyltransferase [Spirochaetales bacterium]|nr:glycosyltransferase [Spirochaetales bacterium]
MNIGLFTDTFKPSINGIVTSIETLRNELEGLGHNVFVFCPGVKQRGKKQYNSNKEENIFRYFSLPYPLLREYRMVIPFPMKFRKIKQLNLDIIHFHTPFLMGLFALYLSKRLRIPLVQTYHTYLTEYVHYVPLPKRIIIPFAIWASRTYCNYSAFVISPSRIIKDVLLSYGVKSEVIIIPTGMKKMNPTFVSPEVTKSTYQIPPLDNILISVGRLAKEKNFAFLLRAFRIIEEHIPHSCLILIGDGPEKKKLLLLAKRLGLENKVKFLGYLKRNEVMEILSASDIFVFASRTETQGLCLLEAMTYGKPIVAIDAMGVVDIMKGDKGGFLVKENEELFAEKVLSLIKNDTLRAAKEKEALVIAEHYSSRNLAKIMIGYYKKAMKMPRTKT